MFVYISLHNYTNYGEKDDEIDDKCAPRIYKIEQIVQKCFNNGIDTLIFSFRYYFLFYEESRKCLAHSYAVHDIAVAGIFAIILGFKPRQKPYQPRTL